MHHFSEANLMISTVTIEMVVAGTSDVRCNDKFKLNSSKGFTPMQNREHVAQAPVKVPLFPLNL